MNRPDPPNPAEYKTSVAEVYTSFVRLPWLAGDESRERFRFGRSSGARPHSRPNIGPALAAGTEWAFISRESSSDTSPKQGIDNPPTKHNAVACAALDLRQAGVPDCGKDQDPDGEHIGRAGHRIQKRRARIDECAQIAGDGVLKNEAFAAGCQNDHGGQQRLDNSWQEGIHADGIALGKFQLSTESKVEGSQEHACDHCHYDQLKDRKPIG